MHQHQHYLLAKHEVPQRKAQACIMRAGWMPVHTYTAMLKTCRNAEHVKDRSMQEGGCGKRFGPSTAPSSLPAPPPILRLLRLLLLCFLLLCVLLCVLLFLFLLLLPITFLTVH